MLDATWMWIQLIQAPRSSQYRLLSLGPRSLTGRCYMGGSSPVVLMLVPAGSITYRRPVRKRDANFGDMFRASLNLTRVAGWLGRRESCGWCTFSPRGALTVLHSNRCVDVN